MKSKNMLLTAMFASALICQPAFADQTKALEHTLLPIQIVELSPIYFGKVIKNHRAGRISLSPNGQVSTSGVSLLDFPYAARYRLCGSKNHHFSLSFTPNAPIYIESQRVGKIDKFALSIAGAAQQFNNDGCIDFSLGAELKLKGNYFDGQLSGQFNISAYYED